ncbi:Exocyst complex component 7 [Boothiomyces macroporosus]|uniref:Exocyst complex protein EXO70 n=1 Tax=Boothiomyces macroporosus TaxID=261099 RepID=A0AAD5Y8M1_9FUNG|nr:Exocyst complex component 7 [Boothiomyces macroporosus]
MVNLKIKTNPISDSQLEKRKALEKKLTEEIAEFEMLETSFNHIDNATTTMTNYLNSFDTRLAKLESYIMPIHNSTQVLTRTNNNLDTAIALVSSYTNVVGTINYHENVLAKGLAQTTLESYLESVTNLKDALHKLEASKYKSSERITQDLRGRLSKGIQELDDLFSKLLSSSSDSCTEEEIQEAKYSFGDNLIKLQTLANMLSDSLEQIGPVTGFLKLYSDIRSAFLVKCMTPFHTAAKDQEVKMGFSKSAYIRKSSLLIPYASALLMHLQAEYLMISEVIPKHHLITTFVITITPPVDAFLECADNLLNRARRNKQNDLYMIVDIWEMLTNLMEPQAALLAHCGKKGHELKSFLVSCGQAVIGFFKEFYDEFKNDSDTKKQIVLSQDGTVHESTSNTINAIKKICEYNDALKLILESCKESNNSFPATSIPDYINKIISLLLVDLDNKSKTYKKPVLSTIFILNNAHFILKSIKSQPLGDIIEKEVAEGIEKTIKKQMDNYRNRSLALTCSWAPTIELLMDTTKISEGGKIVTSLSKAQKDGVKEKFKNFNKEFDEIFATQKTYAIPDVELRAQIIKEIRQVLCPMYNRFYDRYTTSVEFTKNVDKYIKYNKEELNGLIDKFFDSSA